MPNESFGCHKLMAELVGWRAQRSELYWRFEKMLNPVSAKSRNLRL